MAAGRRHFGSIRKRESGRYQVRYPGPDGRQRNAPDTFARKRDADQYLSMIEAQMMRGEWIDPERAKVTLGDYAERWIAQRPNLRPRTVALYRWLLGKHIAPYLGDTELGRLDTPLIREWRAELLGNGVSESMAAKAYRLLRAVLMTAVNEDELLRKNPCRIPGADQEKAPERPVLTMAQALKLAELMEDRYRALVLVTTFACLRWGEVSALQRQDIDADAGLIRIRQAYTEVRGIGLVLGPPKSRAGVRTVSVPAAVMPALRDHLAAFVDDNPNALAFTGPNGRPIWRGNLNKLIGWSAAVSKLGVPGLHFHDLRHTGNTLAARTGASTRELMARMGHDSPQAAMIYQHATAEADRAIAQAVNVAMKAERKKANKAAAGDAPAKSKGKGGKPKKSDASKKSDGSKKAGKGKRRGDDLDDGMAGAVARRR
ncbi:site-specific integrase [Plantactinospora sp. BC1]|uniref:tyrosine-type recombinase/integrase n=1 Tax=Plantactinospora sp. BC1 TaxID=2108470 RepID=UPI000D1667D3|nr:site-specific integrase [Plantactinospora sp. BC1]AVT30917.1 site-specific integrase [Plantactinospora sp. BC1]